MHVPSAQPVPRPGSHVRAAPCHHENLRAVLAGDGDPAERRPPARREPSGQAGGAARFSRAPHPACRLLRAFPPCAHSYRSGRRCCGNARRLFKGSWLTAAPLLRVQKRSWSLVRVESLSQWSLKRVASQAIPGRDAEGHCSHSFLARS